MKTSGIYEIKNIKSLKTYIGSSKDCDKRRNRHFSELRNNKHKNSHLQNSFNLHGSEFFTFRIIEIVEKREMLIKREQFYLNLFKPVFNINKIANSSLGVKRSEETKEKIRKANTGIKHPAWRCKLKSKSQGGDRHWTQNRETPYSDEAREKMSIAQKKLYKDGYKSPVAVPINQYTLNGIFLKEWDSATDVERVLGFKRGAISNCVNNISKTSNNFIWERKKI